MKALVPLLLMVALSADAEAVPGGIKEFRTGTYVRLSALVSGRDVGHRPQPWNGIKVMLKIDTPDGALWPQLELPGGTFAARNFSRRLFLPPDITGLTLILGLEETGGGGRHYRRSLARGCREPSRGAGGRFVPEGGLRSSGAAPGGHGRALGDPG